MLCVYSICSFSVPKSYDTQGSYRLVVDGVGGDFIHSLLQVTEKGGTLVSYGVSKSEETSINLMDLFGNGDQRRIYGLTLYSGVEIEPSSVGLARLLQLVNSDRLRVPAITEGDWLDAPKLANELLERKFSGKAVLTI